MIATQQTDAAQSCDRSECPFFDARKYLRKLREGLPYVPPVNLAGLRFLHSARDYKGIIRVVKRLMNIEAITFQVVWVPDGAAQSGGLKNAPAWVEMPPDMPFYRSKEFEEMTLKMFFRKSFFEQSYDGAILAVAHELSHVVLVSIRHPLRNCEKAVDMTAMLLGFSHLYEEACHKEEQSGNTISIQTLGYLTRDEVRLINRILVEPPPRSKTQSVFFLDVVNPAKILILSAATVITAGLVIWAAGVLPVGFPSPFPSARNLQGPKLVPRGNDSSAHADRTAVAAPLKLNPPPSDIMAAQNRLIELRFLKGPADGVWGSKSRMALRAFKIANALAADDKWDDLVSSRLYSTQAARSPLPLATTGR
jgi:hypothetical protein